VDAVSFNLEQNKIYGLLGRNGAGKTTIMQMLTAQLFATEGRIKVFGEQPYENNRVLRQISFIKESQKYPDVYRVIDALEIAATLYANWDAEMAERLLEDFRLPRKRKIKALSRGMLSSVGIILGLASRAPLTIFDEPYLGLDAVARTLFYDRLLEDYSEHPRTILLSTHLIDEVSNLLEHILVIDKGKILLNEEAESLRGRAFSVVGSQQKIATFLREKQVIHQEKFGNLITATVEGHLNQATRDMAEQLGLELAPLSLQQYVVHLTNNQEVTTKVLVTR
jgi:ABC-2 type transport system ATP-binding protein